VPAEASRLRDFVIALVTGYCNLCDRIIAPSASVASVLRERGVRTPVEVIPTGVDIPRFEQGDGRAFRRSHGISAKAFLAGYVGRLAPEKNLPFLAEAMCTHIAKTKGSQFLVVGSGPSARQIKEIFERHGLRRRLRAVGSLDGQALTDAYHAMDVFVFASHSETQGMVLTVVALDAPGVREVVIDGYNGRLLASNRVQDFAAAMGEIAAVSSVQCRQLQQAARETAERFSMDRCGRELVNVYERLLSRQPSRSRDESTWHQAMEEIKAEWELLKNMAEAVSQAITK
jgi:glycosyltransferase involved in cell wall biosynthesis